MYIMNLYTHITLQLVSELINCRHYVWRYEQKRRKRPQNQNEICGSKSDEIEIEKIEKLKKYLIYLFDRQYHCAHSVPIKVSIYKSQQTEND
jgi:hypothetical protein